MRKSKSKTRLLLEVQQQQQAGRREPIKTWARSCTILPEFVGTTFLVHNGRQHIKVFVTEEMVGHKLGEFAQTRTYRRFRERMAASRPSSHSRREAASPADQTKVRTTQTEAADPADSAQVRPEETTAPVRDWSEQKNARRCDLIDKEIAGNITDEERLELQQLKIQMRRYLDEVAPLPMDDAERVRRELLKNKQGLERKS